MRKLKFYFIGFIPGLLLVFFILNKKGATCSGYLPNSRVIAETLSKDFTYTETFQNQMQTIGINEKFLKDHLITKGEIDFKRSQAQKEPCPEYLLFSPKEKAEYEITFTKCKEGVTFNTLKKLP
ncbi:hypothetical protein [Bergeyella sp. RCAD1439]|uniref:hypothetical protein n=1 Tax=Bergeyella anatis TaxID=3113737 RepID=UPI002E1743A0|nr:hypothetical protein [Bergeyella sp. RCAD1439]